MAWFSLMVNSLVGKTPIGMVQKSGPEVSPLIVVVAVLAHVDM